MKYRVNTRFAVFSVVAIVFVIGFVVLAHRYQAKRHILALPQLAEKAAVAGNTDRAIRFFNYYLEKHPADHDVRIKMAELLEGRAQLTRQKSQALGIYEDILVAEPDRAELRRKLAYMYFDLRLYAKAVPHTEKLLEKSPSDPAILNLHGGCLAGSGDLEGARATYKILVDMPAAKPDAYSALAATLLKLKKPDEADKVMNDMVAKNPQSHKAFLLRGAYRFDRATSQREKAAADELIQSSNDDFMVAIRLAPDDSDVLMLSVGMALNAKDKALARTRLERGLILYRNDLRFYAALADLEVSEGRKQQAVAILDRGVLEVGEQLEPLFDSVDLYLRIGEREKAAAILKRVRRLRGVLTLRVDLAEARIAMAEYRWKAAFQMLEEIRPKLAESSMKGVQIDLELSECARHLGLTVERLHYARQAAKLAPNHPEARFILGAALAASGRSDEAIALYRPLVASVDASDELLLEQARLLILQQAAVPLTAQQWNEVETILDRVAIRRPTDIQVALLRTDMLLLRRQLAAARDVVVAARDKEPKRIELWVALATLDALSGDRGAAARKQAEATLDAAEQRLGESADLRLARLRILFDPTAPKFESLLDQLAKGIERFPKEDQLRLLLALAQANSQSGRLAVARALVDSAIKQHPADLSARLYAFDFSALAQDQPGMLSIVEELKNLQGPSGQLAKYAEAAYFVFKAEAGDRTTIPQATSLIEDLMKADPKSPRPFLLAARLEDLNGNQDAAGAHYQTAVRNGDRSPELLRRVVIRLMAQRKDDDAYNLIRNMELSLVSGIFQRQATELFVRVADYQKAVTLANKAIADQKATSTDYLWHAWVYAASKQYPEAEASLRKAITLGGGAECWIALIRLLVGIKETERARIETAAAEVVLKDSTGRLAVAECREILNEPEKAEAHYRSALAAAPEDVAVLLAVSEFFLRRNRFEAVEEHILKITNRKVPAKPSELAQARRILANGMSLSGDWARCKNALAELAANERDLPGNPQDGAIRAVVLGKMPGRRQEAIRWYEERRKSLSTFEVIALASLYETTGTWLRARQPLLEYLNANANDPVVLADAVNRFLRHNDLEYAVFWFDQLKRLDSDSIRTKTLGARLAIKQQRPNQEVAALLSGLSGQTIPERLAIATVWEELKDVSRAEAILLECAKLEPGRRFSLIHFYGRAGQHLKAMELSEQLLREGQPIDAVIAVVLDALRSRVNDRAMYARIESMLQSPTATQPLWPNYFLTTIREEQGRYDEAVSSAEQFLRDQPDNLFGLIKRARLALFHQRDNGAALQLCNTAIEKYGPLPALVDIRAKALLLSGSEEQARKEWEASASDSDSGVIRYRLGCLHHAAGRKREASNSFRTASELGLSTRDFHPIERAELVNVCKEYKFMLAE